MHPGLAFSCISMNGISFGSWTLYCYCCILVSNTSSVVPPSFQHCFGILISQAGLLLPKKSVNGNHYLLCKKTSIPHPEVKKAPDTVWKLLNPTMGVLTAALPGNMPCKMERGTNASECNPGIRGREFTLGQLFTSPSLAPLWHN